MRYFKCRICYETFYNAVQYKVSTVEKIKETINKTTKENILYIYKVNVVNE